MMETTSNRETTMETTAPETIQWPFPLKTDAYGKVLTSTVTVGFSRHKAGPHAGKWVASGIPLATGSPDRGQTPGQMKAWREGEYLYVSVVLPHVMGMERDKLDKLRAFLPTLQPLVIAKARELDPGTEVVFK